MVNKNNLKVFIHCSSGLVRSPTVVLAYLSIFKRVKSWKNINLSRDFVVLNSQNSVPNVTLVESIVHSNRVFQDKQIDIDSEKDSRRREMMLKYD